MTETTTKPMQADLQASLKLIENALRYARERHNLPSIAAGAVLPDGNTWAFADGLADIEQATPISSGTRYRVASITKTFTGTVLLQLVAEGKLTLDDTVQQHLPWFTLTYPDAPPPTLRHLLTHTGGLPRDATVPHWTEDEFQTWEQVVATTPERKLLAPPLANFAYSNLGYALLGGVIESVTGQSWADNVETRIVQRLGMSDTRVLPTADDDALATGYFAAIDGKRDAFGFIDAKGFAAAANIASTIDDLLTYMRFHLGKSDVALLSPHDLRDMHRPHWTQADWSFGYGLGVQVFREGERMYTGHGGGYKGFLSSLLLHRESGIGVIVLTNSLDSEPYTLAKQIMQVLSEVTTSSSETQAADALLQAYVGVYENDWWSYQILERAGKLEIVPLSDMTAKSQLVPVPDEPHAFRNKRDGKYGEISRFELGDDGLAVRIWTGHDYSTRRID
jgi:D-alanyl-D-alanine carboxypeptidase